MAAVAVLLASAGGSEAATFRWGGMTKVGRYVIDMGSLRRMGTRVDFTALFVPEGTPQQPLLGGLYVRGGHWIDCASSMQARTSTQSFLMSGAPVDAQKASNEAPTPVRPGSTWTSVRDLVCTGRNDIPLPALVGTDPQVAAQVRARMAAHPIAK